MMKKASVFFGLAGAALVFDSAATLDLNIGGGGSISIDPPSVDVEVRPPSVDVDVRPPSVDVDVPPVDVDVRPPSLDVDVPPVDMDVPPPDLDIDINPPAPIAPALADSGEPAFALPVALSPQPCGTASSAHCDHNGGEALFARATAAAIAGVPTAIIAACREGIIRAAQPYDPIQVDVVGAGSAQQLKAGGQIAPLVVRIIYDRQGGYETREARVGCHVNALGQAVALT
jgi:hypothetical protein